MVEGREAGGAGWNGGGRAGLDELSEPESGIESQLRSRRWVRLKMIGGERGLKKDAPGAAYRPSAVSRQLVQRQVEAVGPSWVLREAVSGQRGVFCRGPCWCGRRRRHRWAVGLGPAPGVSEANQIPLLLARPSRHTTMYAAPVFRGHRGCWLIGLFCFCIVQPRYPIDRTTGAPSSPPSVDPLLDLPLSPNFLSRQDL